MPSTFEIPWWRKSIDLDNVTDAATLIGDGAAVGLHNAGSAAVTVTVEHWDGTTGTFRLDAGQTLRTPRLRKITAHSGTDTELEVLFE